MLRPAITRSHPWFQGFSPASHPHSPSDEVRTSAWLVWMSPRRCPDRSRPCPSHRHAPNVTPTDLGADQSLSAACLDRQHHRRPPRIQYRLPQAVPAALRPTRIGYRTAFLHPAHDRVAKRNSHSALLSCTSLLVWTLQNSAALCKLRTLGRANARRTMTSSLRVMEEVEALRAIVSPMRMRELISSPHL